MFSSTLSLSFYQKPYRFLKQPTIINPQMRWFRRTRLWQPNGVAKRVMRKQEQLDAFEAACADGHKFVPDGRLPPWRKRVNAEFDRAQGRKVNFAGFRVRLAQPTQSPEGFPTHWQ